MNARANRLTTTLGIDYPMVQGPLGGLKSQRLTAAVANFGGLGSFGALSLSPDDIRNAITEIRRLTHKPFAVNLWVSGEDEGARSSGAIEFERVVAQLADLYDELGVTPPAYAPYTPVQFENQVAVLLEMKVAAFSFIFGIPPRTVLSECRERGIATIGSATTVDEAVALDQAGVDAIVASGFEAGGHRGSFLGSAEDSLIGTMSLVPQVVDAVGAPVIAAGGIADSRGVSAALALGAEGVQMGTAFLPFEESGASGLHRELIREKRATSTGLTKKFTGRLARGVRNRLMDALSDASIESLPYPLQRAIIRPLSAAADAAGRADLAQLWAGQSANLAPSGDVATFLSSLLPAFVTSSAQAPPVHEPRRARPG